MPSPLGAARADLSSAGSLVQRGSGDQWKGAGLAWRDGHTGFRTHGRRVARRLALRIDGVGVVALVLIDTGRADTGKPCDLRAGHEYHPVEPEHSVPVKLR